MRIGLDIMGGDHYPYAPIEGAFLWSSEQDADTTLVLIGEPNTIESELAKYHLAPSFRFEILPSNQVIEMDDHPAKAILSKVNSSISVGLMALKKGEIDCFISAGHSGAMLAGSVLVLGTVPGVQRPTVSAVFPSKNNPISLVADVGANTECKPEHLVQFAQLASVFLKETLQIENPRVALLNIGEEKKKGTPLQLQSYSLLEQTPGINFVGNMQGWDIIEGRAEIYVCDGFTGNILLKFGESMYGFFKPKLPNDPDIERFNFEAVGGLPFLGVNGNVILGHGISGPVAFKNMLLQAVRVVRSGLVRKIAETFTTN